jgi:DNA repair exonuclease SbcCD ATPase subunit
MKEYIATVLGAGVVGLLPFLNNITSQPSAPVSIPSLQKQPIIQLQKSGTTSGKRHRIQVQVISLNDLKIVEGSEVAAGQIISDRTEERESLEAQRNQIDISIKQLSTSMSKVAELPPPNFAVQEAAIARIKSGMELIGNKPPLPATPAPFFRFKDEKLRKLLEAEKINKIADDIRAEASERAKVGEAKAKLALELNQAIAALDKAQSDHQHQQYQHSLNLIRQQSEMQRQQYQVASLVAQKQEIEAKLREITQIKSPVFGKVRRIKNLGQKDRAINLEVVIDIFTATSTQ